MAQPFNFGFDNEDIDDEGTEEDAMELEEEVTASGEEASPSEPRLYSLEEMVCASHLIVHL